MARPVVRLVNLEAAGSNARRGATPHPTWAVVGALAVLALGGCAAADSTGPTAVTPAPPSAPPPSAATAPTAVGLRLACSADGVAVLSDATVAATPGGVVLTVTSSMPRGSYVTYTSTDGPAGGKRVFSRPRTFTLPVPPGRLTLGCAPRRVIEGDSPVQAGATGQVTATDPQGFWRQASPIYRACGPATQPAWVRGLTADGDTAELAVDGVLDNLARTLPGVLAAVPANTGYVGAARQTWVATKDGQPHLTIEVVRAGSGYSAGPASLCGLA